MGRRSGSGSTRPSSRRPSSRDRGPVMSSDWEPDFEALEARDAEYDSMDGEAMAEEAELQKTLEEKKGYRIETIDKAIAFAHVLHRYRQEQDEIVAGADKSIQAL